MFYAMFSAVFLGGAVGAFAEYFGFARNGYVVSVAVAVGGAVILVFAQSILGVGLGVGRAGTSLIGAGGAPFLASMRR